MQKTIIHAVLLTGSLALSSLLMAEDNASVLPTPTTPGRPHAQHDPHGKLTPEQHINVALQHIQEGRMGDAMRTLDRVIVMSPESASARAVRGSILLQQNRIAPALEDLEAAIRLDPKDAKVYVNRAHAYFKFGRLDAAMADLNKAIEIDADLVAARFYRGSMRFNKGDLKGSLSDFDHCIAVDPHAPGPYFNRAAVHDSMGNAELAIADMERFLELAKDEKSQKAGKDVLRSWKERGESDKGKDKDKAATTEKGQDK